MEPAIVGSGARGSPMGKESFSMFKEISIREIGGIIKDAGTVNTKMNKARAIRVCGRMTDKTDKVLKLCPKVQHMMEILLIQSNKEGAAKYGEMAQSMTAYGLIIR